MSTTVPIPTTTLTVGPHDVAPVTVGAAVVQVLLTIDRTVANGFNSQPATTKANIQVQQSDDNGATWWMIAAADIVGGVYQDKHGVNYTKSTLTVSLAPAPSRQLKATIVVSGASVAVAGSLTIQ